MFFGKKSSTAEDATTPASGLLQVLLEQLNGNSKAAKLRKSIEQTLKSDESERSRRLAGLYLEVENRLAEEDADPVDRRRELRNLVRAAFPDLEAHPELSLVLQEEKAKPPATTNLSQTQPIVLGKGGTHDASDEASLLKVVLRSVNEGIIAMGEDNVISLVNPAVEKIWGHPADELVGHDFIELLPEEYREAHRSGLKRFIGVPLELEGLRSNGQRFPISISISTTEFEGKPIFTATVQDITMRKYIEDELVHSKDELEERVAERTKDLLETQRDLEQRARELERTNTELQQFAYVASHDLQEPLRSITSFIQILNRRFGEQFGEEAQEYMGFVVDGAKRMQDLINELLDYSRAGRGDRGFSEIDLNNIISQVKANLHATIEETGATIESDDLPTLGADDRQMIQLFQNLIENGIKFRGEERPLITIRCQDRVTHWEFAVTDNGIGIDEKFKDRIFVIFQRLHTRDHYPGNGIGLAICKKIVERHGGFISLDTENATGCRFVFGIAKDLTERAPETS